MLCDLIIDSVNRSALNNREIPGWLETVESEREQYLHWIWIARRHEKN